LLNALFCGCNLLLVNQLQVLLAEMFIYTVQHRNVFPPYRARWMFLAEYLRLFVNTITSERLNLLKIWPKFKF